jgi:hypothetical protein
MSDKFNIVSTLMSPAYGTMVTNESDGVGSNSASPSNDCDYPSQIIIPHSVSPYENITSTRPFHFNSFVSPINRDNYVNQDCSPVQHDVSCAGSTMASSSPYPVKDSRIQDENSLNISKDINVDVKSSITFSSVDNNSSGGLQSNQPEVDINIGCSSPSNNGFVMCPVADKKKICEFKLSKKARQQELREQLQKAAEKKRY